MAGKIRQKYRQMKAGLIRPLVDRTYHGGGPLQWVRELYLNAVEAGATRIEFLVEWQGAEDRGVFRRMVADNGSGIPTPDLPEFFLTFGGGGKPIGPMHENFGVGAKTSLLPWNHRGVVVISYHEGVASMIWIELDEQTGEYALRAEEVVDPDTGETELADVWEPVDEVDQEVGINWATVAPDWVRDEGHGTVIVLLGNEPEQWTFKGDPSRAEVEWSSGTGAEVSGHLNRRFWELVPGTKVEEFALNDTEKWPRSRAAFTKDSRTFNRDKAVKGARAYVAGHKSQSLVGEGVVPLTDGTKVHWYLSDKPSPTGGSKTYGTLDGYISVTYQGELFHTSDHHGRMRSFGIYEQDVRKRVWLFIEPPPYDQKRKRGTYPDQSRDALKMAGGTSNDLPWARWAQEFADDMPDAIRTALREADSDDASTLEDEETRKRIWEKVGKRFARTARLLSGKGLLTTNPTERGAPYREPDPDRDKTKTKIKVKPRPKPDPKDKKERLKPKVVGYGDGDQKAREADRKTAPLPEAQWRPGSEFPEEWMLATFDPPDKLGDKHPGGLIKLNQNHPVIVEAIDHWQQRFAEHQADPVRKDVMEAYKQVAIAKVAHTETLKKFVTQAQLQEKFRSEEALTAALMGFIAEDAIIGPMLGKLGRQQKAA